MGGLKSTYHLKLRNSSISFTDILLKPSKNGFSICSSGNDKAENNFSFLEKKGDSRFYAKEIIIWRIEFDVVVKIRFKFYL